MEKEVELLSRVAVNHLFLGQFEPFRAAVLSLRRRDPDLAASLLRAVVARAGRIDGVLPSPSCPSPSHLAWLSALELLPAHDDPDALRSKAEFLLLAQLAASRSPPSPVLDRVLELGVRLLGREFGGGGGEGFAVGVEDEAALRKAVLDDAEVFDAMCAIAKKQVELPEPVANPETAITLSDGASDGDSEALRWLLKNVQMAHLLAIKKCLEEGDDIGALSHLRFLHLDHGVELPEYKMILKEVIGKTWTRKCDYGDEWYAQRSKMLLMYANALSSQSMELAQTIQIIEDELLSEEIECLRASTIDFIPPPLKRLQIFMNSSIHVDESKQEDSVATKMVPRSCMRELYHHARVSGVHILESVIDAALISIKREELQEASNYLSLFPLLQPLVASMGWDLLSGKTSARRKLMQLCWTSKSQMLRLEESSLYRKQSDEVSDVEHLCDILCYRLDLASFAACVNCGKQWNSKMSVLLSRKEQMVDENADMFSDAFMENYVLEKLTVQGPMQVLFDVVPEIKIQDAIELISMQPIASTPLRNRMQDIELVHMRYALLAIVQSLEAMELSALHKNEAYEHTAFAHLEDLKFCLNSITNVSHKIMMIGIIIGILHIESVSVDGSQRISMTSEEHFLSTNAAERKQMVAFFDMLLDIMNCNLPSSSKELEGTTTAERQALEWRIMDAKHFVEDWKWRLSILQRLLPLSVHNWSWKEALTILRAAPSKLLNVCMQRAEYDIGEQAVQRFSLPPEDRAILELVEWLDRTFTRASVEDTMSRVAEGKMRQPLDLSSFRAQLGSLAAILLCIDVAATVAKSVDVCKQLLDQGRVLLSEIYPGVPPRTGSSYWDQILDVTVISVTKRILQRMQDIVEQERPATLQMILSGTAHFSVPKESRRGQRQRALSILHQMIDDAHDGKRQFLSGKLHNLARALADEEEDTNHAREDIFYSDRKVFENSEKDVVLGVGLRVMKASSTNLGGEESEATIKDSAKRVFGSLSGKPVTYLSAFILYIASIGDVVDGTDTTHDFNFFSVVFEWPKDLITRLVFERGNSDAAGKLADIMCVDFVHEVISSCVPPVYPPRAGHDWACIPLPSLSFEARPTSKASACPSGRVELPSFNLLPRSDATSYALHLNIVKHLAKLSPVRAVLASVFGSNMLLGNKDSSLFRISNDSLSRTSDSDRLFYEFALDQSERFPTLNRWIQMQSNLHRVSESTSATNLQFETHLDNSMVITNHKRAREPENDTEQDADNNTLIVNTCTPELVSSNYLKSENVMHEVATFLSFDSENERPYEIAVERLISEGKVMDALALSDRCLRHGASDKLLQLLIEYGEGDHLDSGRGDGFGTTSFWRESWQLCQRLKNKQLAAKLALKYLHRWDLDSAMDVLTMCNCHLPETDPLKSEVLQTRQALLRYKHILCADDRCQTWQEVEAECQEDPEGLVLRLAGKGAVSAALEVAESASLSIDLRRELQGRQLVKLLTTDPLSGGGPAQASRFLTSLPNSDDALPVAISAMQLLSDLRSKQLLVHFFLKRWAGNLTTEEVSRLNKWALGLRVLSFLPLPWQQRCSALHEHPHLIVEVLLMRKQLQSASLIMKEFPMLRDNSLILTYSAKAISVTISSPPREQRISVMGLRPKLKAKAGMPSKSNFTNSLSNFQKEARRAFSWGTRDIGNRIAPKEVQRKRKSSGLTSSDRAAWEAMTGEQDERVSVYSFEGQDRLPSVSIADEWILTGDTNKDDAIRSAHKFETSPDIILFKALLSLSCDELVSARGALDLCVSQMKNVLSQQQLTLHASMEVLARAYHATETYVQGLMYAKSQLRKLSGTSDLSSSSDRSRETDDASSDAGSSGNSQYTDDVSELVFQADFWLGRAELLQSLLGSGIVASIDDVADKESSARLRDRLIEEEQYSMAVYTCRKCKIDAFPVWNAWGHALIRMEHYTQARVKFKQALQLYKGDSIPVIMEIINTMEGGPPADVTAARSMYEHFAKSAATIFDDSLSADAYLNVLYMPSTYPRGEKPRLFRYASNNPIASSSDFEYAPRSNLDSARYAECVSYLQEFARSQLLGFMFKHGHYSDACMLFFPPNGIPSAPTSPLLGISNSASSTPQRPDPLATEYGTVDDLCDLCITYGVMPVLENVFSTRMTSAISGDTVVSQHTAASLIRICAYCETHRHFNYLYKFQVIRKDHVAAGLCCVQLYINSSSQEEAIKHLEHAKYHFEEGRFARQRAGEVTKLIPKSARGKSASEKLTEEGLIKLGSAASLQADVLRSFNDVDGPPWKYSLFGNPNDLETFRRRCEVAEKLAEKNFDLAYHVIYVFNLPAVDIYAGVASSLAEKKRGGQLADFLKNIKNNVNHDDWDQVLGAAINVYANKHKERQDRLIDMLISSHRKVLACVVCGRLKSAFQIASRSGSVADVQYVAHQALHSNALPVLDMCKQWLAQNM